MNNNNPETRSLSGYRFCIVILFINMSYMLYYSTGDYIKLPKLAIGITNGRGVISLLRCQ